MFLITGIMRCDLEQIFAMKALLVLQVSLILISIAYGQLYDNNVSKYEGAQRINIEKSPIVENMLKQRHLDVWSANSTFYDVVVRKHGVNKLMLLLRSHGVLYAVKDANVAKTLRKHSLENRIICNQTSMRNLNDRNLPTFNCYQNVEEIYDYLDHLAKTYPEIVSVDIIGYGSIGKALKVIKISSGHENAKAFLIDGGIHAREWIAPAAVTFIIKQLVANRMQLPSELLNLDFYAIPILNPEGYEYSYKVDRLWRKNRSKNGPCYGVDLNRNFQIEFGGKGSSENPCEVDYHGRNAESEKETQAFVHLVLNITEDLTGYITFHSFSQCILIPFGYDTNSYAPDFVELKKVGDEAAAAMKQIDGKNYTVGNTAEVLYPAAGASSDWVKTATRAKYVYTIELRDEGEYGFELPASLILPTAKEAFEAVKVIASAAYREQMKV